VGLVSPACRLNVCSCSFTRQWCTLYLPAAASVKVAHGNASPRGDAIQFEEWAFFLHVCSKTRRRFCFFLHLLLAPAPSRWSACARASRSCVAWLCGVFRSCLVGGGTLPGGLALLVVVRQRISRLRPVLGCVVGALGRCVATGQRINLLALSVIFGCGNSLVILRVWAVGAAVLRIGVVSAFSSACL